MDNPTIKQFADCLGISQPNATYKVSSLIEKGYIKKEISADDRREAHLRMSEKFFGYFDPDDAELKDAVSKLDQKFSAEELEIFEKILTELNNELD